MCGSTLSLLAFSIRRVLNPWSFSSIINAEAWAGNFFGSLAHTFFLKKIEAVKNALKKWNKHQILLIFLKISDGVWIFDRNDIGTCFSDHFQNVYSSTNPILSSELDDLLHPIVTEEDNKSLCAIPSEEEIFCTLPKAPGCSALFYKHYWHIVRSNVWW